MAISQLFPPQWWLSVHHYYTGILFTYQMLKSEDKAAVESLLSICQKMVDCLVQTVLTHDGNCEGKEMDLVSCAKTLHLFCNLRPSLLLSHVSTLHHYLGSTTDVSMQQLGRFILIDINFYLLHIFIVIDTVLRVTGKCVLPLASLLYTMNILILYLCPPPHPPTHTHCHPHTHTGDGPSVHG